MTQFLLKMGAIFNVSFLILCAVLSEEIVVASEDNLESSSVLHNRQKRMDSTLGSSPLQDLPPFLEYNLRKLEMDNPTQVEITDISGDSTGRAIHPYLVVTHLGNIHAVFGVSSYVSHVGGLKPQRVETFYPHAVHQVAVILLRDPLQLHKPVRGAFSHDHYQRVATEWAKAKGREWIRTQLPILQPLLEQNLYNLHFDHPTKVQITSYGEPTGPGYAIHPYIVITHNDFFWPVYGVTSHMEATGTPKPHRVQYYYINIYCHLVVFELLDPVLLTNDASVTFSAENYSIQAMAWARGKAEEWKRTRLGNVNLHSIPRITAH